MRPYIVIATFLCLASSVTASAAQETLSCPGLLYATDFGGSPSAGSKDALMAAVERGEPIRVGWRIDFDDDGDGDLAHWADASFLSVWEGDVFTQIDAVHAQSPQRGENAIALREPYAEWRGSLSSSGTLDGAFSNGEDFPNDLTVAVTWCSAAPRGGDWTPLYRNGTSGETLAGSKDALFAAIRAGLPIRIGWGFSAERNGETLSVEHAISPVFISIVNGNDVAAQLPEHIAQRGYIDVDVALFDDPAVMWRGLMTTKGVFDAVWVNRATGEEVRRYPQRAALTWYAPVSPSLATPTLAVPDGVTTDEARASERTPR